MKGTLQPIFLPTVLILLTSVLPASAQEVYHEFANKDGQKIEAKIVSITPDWKSMKIQRRDGQEFDMAVNVLSLNDQQIVKEWIKANPGGAKIDFNLDVGIEKKSKTVKNLRSGDYKYKTAEISYEISIKNRSRQPLAGARADYVVIMENVVSVDRSEGGGFDFSGGFFGSDESGDIVYLRKSETLPESLELNHDHTFLTEKIESHQIFGDGNVSYGADKMLGVIVRVIGPNDDVIGEYRSAEAHVQKVTWDEVKGNAFRSRADRPAGSRSAAVETPDLSSTSGMPPWLEVRELSEWPEKLSKGDTVPASVVPRSGGKIIRLSALVDIDEEQSDGTILASGGQAKGFSLFVHDGALRFRSKKLSEEMIGMNQTIEVPLSELPADEFKVNAVYDSETLRLWINDELKAEGKSVGLFHTRPQEGLSVGYDSEDSSVGPVSPPHAFRGSIREVDVQFAD